MTKETTNREGSLSTWKTVGVIVLALIIAGIIFWLLTLEKNTLNTDNRSSKKETSLRCTAASIDNGIFDTANAVSTSYAIDAIFYDDELDNLTYTYEGIYDDHDAAVKAEARAHANFNIQLGNAGLPEDQFNSTTFSIIDNEMRLLNHAEKNDITDISARFILLKAEETNGAKKIPRTFEEVKKNYEGLGFLCKKGA